MESSKTHPAPNRLLSFILLLVLLLLIPILTIIFGQITRKQIKADVSCQKPEVPDPSECVGGEWKLYKNADGCLRFSCQLNQP